MTSSSINKLSPQKARAFLDDLLALKKKIDAKKQQAKQPEPEKKKTA